MRYAYLYKFHQLFWVTTFIYNDVFPFKIGCVRFFFEQGHNDFSGALNIWHVLDFFPEYRVIFGEPPANFIGNAPICLNNLSNAPDVATLIKEKLGTPQISACPGFHIDSLNFFEAQFFDSHPAETMNGSNIDANATRSTS